MGPREPVNLNYIDTSALVRLIDGVGTTTPVEHALHENPRASEFLSLELHCALFKRAHDTGMSSKDRDTLIRVGRDLLASVSLERLDNRTHALALSVAQIAPVRTLDAVHIATALWAHGVAPATWEVWFTTSDAGQAEAARKVLPNVVLMQ